MFGKSMPGFFDFN